MGHGLREGDEGQACALNHLERRTILMKASRWPCDRIED